MDWESIDLSPIPREIWQAAADMFTQIHYGEVTALLYLVPLGWLKSLQPHRFVYFQTCKLAMKPDMCNGFPHTGEIGLP